MCSIPSCTVCNCIRGGANDGSNEPLVLRFSVLQQFSVIRGLSSTDFLWPAKRDEHDEVRLSSNCFGLDRKASILPAD